MQISKKEITPTKVIITIAANDSDLSAIKRQTLQTLAKTIKLPGFRNGKAPLKIVEKNLDQNVLQTQFLDDAINVLYQKAIRDNNVRVVDNPKVTLKKFVPFTDLEFDAEVDIIGTIKLADYSKIKKQIKPVSLTAKDVTEVIDSLRQRSAERKAVNRPAKSKDEVIIDFVGKNQKNQPIKGAEGENYPLVIGSKTFIPGFEENLLSMNPGQEKTFTLTFPKDYGVKALANKKVNFTVTVKTVNEILTPTLNDEFASKVGPFKNIEELKADIKKQLKAEKESQAARALENEIIQDIVNQSTVNLPEVLVIQQIERLKGEIRQNLMYRGQTWQEMLEAEGLNEDEYIAKQLRPEAEHRVKTGLILSEISVAEGIDITPEELEVQIQTLKTQYTDATMQTELNKPEARQDIASRMLTEKTVRRLVELATT